MIPEVISPSLPLSPRTLVLLLAPGPALAQEKTDDVYVRVNGTVDLASGESVDTLVAVNSEARVAGRGARHARDRQSDGDGLRRRWPGSDRGQRHASSRTDGAHRGDVVLINGELNQADGAEIGGRIVERSGASIGAEFNRVTAAVSLIAWLGMTLLVVVVALGWAAVGGCQLSDIAGLLGARPGWRPWPR